MHEAEFKAFLYMCICVCVYEKPTIATKNQRKSNQGEVIAMAKFQICLQCGFCLATDRYHAHREPSNFACNPKMATLAHSYNIYLRFKNAQLSIVQCKRVCMCGQHCSVPFNTHPHPQACSHIAMLWANHLSATCLLDNRKHTFHVRDRRSQ